LTTGSASEELIEVRIVAMPLDVYKASSEHFDELKREFGLIRESEASSIPDNLLRVIDQLTSRYSGFSSTPNRIRDEALERGDATVDLVYQLPPSVKDACIDLERLLDEADEFCRSGGHLLTLAAPKETVEFRSWFLGEFVRQIHGEEAMSWPQYRSVAGRPTD
jgi:hypothetical protein